MTMSTTPPDTYWMQPDPDPLEQANQDADNLVAEWASEGEYEVWIGVWLHTLSFAPYFVLQRVAHDGETLYDEQPGAEFDTIDQLRAHMERLFPLLPQQ